MLILPQCYHNATLILQVGHPGCGVPKARQEPTRATGFSFFFLSRHRRRHRLFRAVILSAGTPIPARWTCRRRCRYRADIAGPPSLMALGGHAPCIAFMLRRPSASCVYHSTAAPRFRRARALYRGLYIGSVPALYRHRRRVWACRDSK